MYYSDRELMHPRILPQLRVGPTARRDVLISVRPRGTLVQSEKARFCRAREGLFSFDIY